MRIFLIGYMGVGKTTIGKTLAKRLNLQFIDLDGFISSKEHVDVAGIIRKNGEDYFRNLEQKALNEVSKLDNVLVSTGGGTPCFFDNMDVIIQNGLSIYLEMDVKSLVNRLKNSQDSRPLLKGKNEIELEEFIAEHLNTRKPYYEKAQMTVSGLNWNADKYADIVAEIETAMT